MCFFNILILLFLLCSISLPLKYDFILRYEAWVNAIRMSSFIENFPRISAKPIAFQRNLLGKLSRNRPFFINRFSATLTSKIPWNQPFFPTNLSLKIPRILTFFSATYQKPCYYSAFHKTFDRRFPKIIWNSRSSLWTWQFHSYLSIKLCTWKWSCEFHTELH